MSETDEMKKLIAEQRKQREAATDSVKQAAERVDRRRAEKREQSNRPA